MQSDSKSADLRMQIKIALSNNPLTAQFTKRQDDAIVDLVLEHRALEAEWIAPKLFKASDSAECIGRAAELRSMKPK
jgi:hypothetical protein